MYHTAIQEKHAIRHDTKWGVVKVYDTTMAAVHMMAELPKGSVRINHHCIWVPYPDVKPVERLSITYEVDKQGMCYEQV